VLLWDAGACVTHAHVKMTVHSFGCHTYFALVRRKLIEPIAMPSRSNGTTRIVR
jgi:hypothetical protein